MLFRSYKDKEEREESEEVTERKKTMECRNWKEVSKKKTRAEKVREKRKKKPRFSSILIQVDKM